MQDIGAADLIGYDPDHCLVFREPVTREVFTFSQTSEETPYSDLGPDETAIAETALFLPSIRDICNKMMERSGKEQDGDYEKHLPANCYAAACALAELIGDGPDVRAVYGAYWGPSVTRPGTFHRHGWVIFGNHIVDPTRWVFEGESPYVFVGMVDQDEEYDEGMARMRVHRPPPAKGTKVGHGNQGPFRIDWRKGEAEEVQQLFGDNRDVDELDMAELFWLANMPPDVIKPFIVTFYSWLESTERISLVPIDFRHQYDHWKKHGEIT